jgi:hypothetical protein
MEIIIILLTVATGIAAFMVVPEIRRYLNLDKARSLRIEGKVGQLDKSKIFTDFIQANDGKIVFIDIYIPDVEFHGTIEGETPYFVLFDECFDFGSNKTLSTSNCTGTEFNISNLGKATDFHFSYSRDNYRLRGYFAILGFDGPHQGLMGVSLRPVNYENVN